MGFLVGFSEIGYLDCHPQSIIRTNLSAHPGPSFGRTFRRDTRLHSLSFFLISERTASSNSVATMPRLTHARACNLRSHFERSRGQASQGYLPSDGGLPPRCRGSGIYGWAAQLPVPQGIVTESSQ